MSPRMIRKPIPKPDDSEENTFDSGYNSEPDMEGTEFIEGMPAFSPKDLPRGRGSIRKPIPKPDVSGTDFQPKDLPPEKRNEAGSKQMEIVKTKGGDYPVYATGSEVAKKFNAAFAEARKKGLKEFEWHGRKYSTKKA